MVLYKLKIEKLKQKRKIVKSLSVNLIVSSMTSSMVCATLSSLVFIGLPIILLFSLNFSAGKTTALFVELNLGGEKDELKKKIVQLGKSQPQVDDVVSCNGTFDAD